MHHMTYDEGLDGFVAAESGIYGIDGLNGKIGYMGYSIQDIVIRPRNPSRS
jgi:citrate synthase